MYVLPLLLFAGTLGLGQARADLPTEDPRDRTRDLPTEIDQLGTGLNPTLRGEITFKGTVLGADREAIPGVRVLLVIGGLVAEEHTTDGVGQYSFARTIDFSRDETVLLWFEDPSRLLSPKAFVLDESEAAQQQRLLSPCLTRLRVEPTIESTIYLFDVGTKIKTLVEKQCL
jgi:hypothetical protein